MSDCAYVHSFQICIRARRVRVLVRVDACVHAHVRARACVHVCARVCFFPNKNNAYDLFWFVVDDGSVCTHARDSFKAKRNEIRNLRAELLQALTAAKLYKQIRNINNKFLCICLCLTILTIMCRWCVLVAIEGEEWPCLL